MEEFEKLISGVIQTKQLEKIIEKHININL